jgi:hypothetical protein
MDGIVTQNHRHLTLKEADCPLSNHWKAGSWSGSIANRRRRYAEMGAKAAGLMLQMLAPKCAFCWTTYAGLLNMGWFAATQLHPVWLIASISVLIVTLALMFRQARRTRRYGGPLCTVAAVLLMATAWITGIERIRYAGPILLLASFVVERLSPRAQGMGP